MLSLTVQRSDDLLDAPDKRLVAGIGICTVLLFFAFPTANASCLPEGSQTDDDIVCIDTDTNPVVSGNGSDTITVSTGASLDVQESAPATSVTAIDSGNQNDTVINFGSVSACLVTDTPIALLNTDINSTWNDLISVGISLGNGDDYLGNHGSLVVSTTLNMPSTTATNSIVTTQHGNEPPLTQVTATGVVGGNGQDVVVNSGDIIVTAQDDTGSNSVSAVGINSGNGRDVITNTGTIIVTASSAQPEQLAIASSSTAGRKPTDSSEAGLTAIGIDAGNAADAVITNTGTLEVHSSSDGSVTQVSAQGILGGNGKDVIFNDGVVNVTAENIVDESSSTASLTGGDDLTATTTLSTSATGIDSGNGGDIITNDGVVSAEALSDLGSFNVELNLIDTSHADTSVSLYSNSIGVAGGNGKDTVDNTGSIEANATSRMDTVNVEVNGVDAGLADSKNLLNSEALALTTGSGNDTIVSSGSITASATSELDEVGVNVSYADVTIADRDGSDTSTQLYSDAIAIDSGSGNDYLFLDSAANVDATALSDVYSIGVSIASEGVPASTESLFIDGSLANVGLESYSQTSGIVTGQGNDDLVNLGSVTSEATANSSQVGVNVGIALIDFVVPTPGLVLGGGGTSAEATSVGFDLGQGQDSVSNSGSLLVDAQSTADSTIVSVNIAELSIGGIDGFPGLGAAVVAADTTTFADSTALGISAGSGNDVVDNTGTMTVTAGARGDSTSASAGLGIQIGQDDDALQIDAILARAETQSTATASGITGNDGHDQINNTGTMTIASEAETDALGIGIDIAGTVQATGITIGATLTDTSSTSTANAIGIDGGDESDVIVNSGSMDVDAISDTNNINASVTVGFAKQGLVAGAALARAETEGVANAVGIDGGDGKDNITNDGTLDVKATSDVDSVAVSVTVGGTSQGLAAGAALADGGATALASATGIRSGDSKTDNNNSCNQHSANGGNQSQCSSSNNKPDKLVPDIVNNNTIVVDAEANTHTTSVAADVQIAKEGVAIGAALADNSARAEATSIGIETNELDDVIVNNGDIQLKSDAYAQAVSVGVSVQGTSSGLSAGAALTNASVTSNATATGVHTGAGDDVVLNTGTIRSGNEAENQVQSTATAVGVSVASQLVLEAGAALGAALADTDAKAIANLTAIDGGQGDDQLINQGAIDLQNVGANADAVSVSVDVAIAPTGLAGGAAVANSDSTAELTANGMVGAEGRDLLINESTIDLENMTADADSVSVSLTVTGAEAGVTLSGALVDAEATATANAIGLSGGDDEDYLKNVGAINIDSITANADAVGVGVGFSFAGEGVAASAALARSGTTSNVNVQGMDGGTADDKLINDGTITLNNINADSDAVSVSVGASGTAGGLALSAGLTDASGHANAMVTGMDGGSGDDLLLNNNSITVSNVNADAHATGVSVTAQFSAAGLAGGFSLANTSGVATTLVQGLDGGEGNDLIHNNGNVDLSGTATADALSIALNISASVGLGGGAAITDASSTAQSTVLGINGGNGFDDITNTGEIDVTANAVTESTAASVGITVAIGADATLADAESTATSTAIGIYDPGGDEPKTDDDPCGKGGHNQQQSQSECNHHHNDDPPQSQLANLGAINATATADSEGLAISGNLLGYALGETTNTSTADAAGIRFDQGPALIYNEGPITANSSAVAEGLSVTVTLGGYAVGDTSTTANGFASGIESGDGDDKVFNVTSSEGATINVDARSYASGESISVGLIGVQEANTTNTANASATGINTGAGDDEVLNDAIMIVSAGNPLTADGSANCGAGSEGACAESFAVSATLAGYGSVDASSVANANALGITGGEGNDVVQSDQAITVTSLARGSAEGISVTLLGANDAAANTTSNAGVTGLAGEAGRDTLINNSDLTAHSAAETYANSFSLTIFGATSASANTTTTADAVGMDGGADNDKIFNFETGHIDVSASTTSEAHASSWTFAGAASAATTLGALTSASGIDGGSGDDIIGNLGDIDVQTQSSLAATGGANAIFGNAEAGSTITATTNAYGIDAGAGDNVIENGGQVTVDAVANMLASTTSYSFAGGASTSEFITANATAAAIVTGDGQFSVTNSGDTLTNITATARTQGSSSASFAGGTDSSGTVAATVDAAGIDGRAGAGEVFNKGNIVINANGEAWATHSSEAGVFFSDGGVVASSSAHLNAYGITLGDGDNKVKNGGNIDVQLSTGTSDYNGDGISEGVFARARAEGGDFDIFTGNGDASGKVTASADALIHGIAMGDGDNQVHNTGRVSVSGATSGIRATAFADPNGGAVTIDGDGWGEAYTTMNLDARGIVSGDGQFSLLNEGEIEVSVAPAAVSGVDADGGSSGDTDVFVDARVTSNVFAVSAGEGEHGIANTGSIVVSNAASAAVNGNANGNGIDGDGRVGYGINLDQLPGYARIDAVTAGIDLGSGSSYVLNEGSLILNDNTGSNALAYADSDFTGAANAFARSEIESASYAIRTRGADSYIENSGSIDLVVAPNAVSNASGYASGNGSRAWGTAISLTQLDTQTHGILAEGDGSYVMQTGSITIDADANVSAGSNAESNLDGDSYSQATANMVITATGIETLGMGGMVEQHGDIAVNLNVSASATAWSRADGALGDTRARSISIADVDARGVGVHVAEGNGTLLNDGSIDVVTTASTSTSTDTEAPGLPKGVENNWSLATAESYGLWAGAEENSLAIINAGDITVDAVSTAQVSTVGSTYMHTQELAHSSAIGIYAVDEADFSVVNTGTIIATASAASNWNDLGLPPIAEAVGIRTGVGDDLIINLGTIDTSETTNGVTTLGTAIDSGGGDDVVILGDGSITNGDINLGTGDDILSMEGTPIINGSIIDDSSSMTLAFNNDGSYDGGLAGYRAVKNGTGTFTLSNLPQMTYLEMNQGTLQLNNDYEFHDEGMFQATIYGNGSNGQFLVNGTASLNGQMNVSRGHGAFLDGTTFEVLTATDGFSQDTAFDDIVLPDARPLLSFQLQQTEESMIVQADVESFTTVATTGNAGAVASHLDAILPTATGDLSYILGEVQVLSEQQEFSDAFYSLSPAAYQQYSLASVASGQQYTNSLNARMSDLHFTEMAKAKRDVQEKPIMLAVNSVAPQGMFTRAEQDYQYGIYIRAFGQHGVQDTAADEYGYDFTVKGELLGFDHKFSDRYIGGISVGSSTNDLTADRDMSAGDIDTTLYSLYGSYLFNKAYLDAVLSYGDNTYETVRRIVIGSTNAAVESSHEGNLTSFSLAGGQYYEWGSWWLRPYASLQYSKLDEDGFTESGTGASLIVDSRTTEALISQLGVSFLHDHKVASGYITTELDIGWIHDFDIDDHVINASYVGAPDASFSIEGQTVEEDGISLGAGFSYETNTGYITTIKLNSEFRDSYNANSFVGEFRYEF